MFSSTKLLSLGSCAFRQWRATHSHCQYIHGYELKAKLYFASEYLDDKNWVMDFGGLKELKEALEEQFDHKLCVAKDDPLLDQFLALEEAGGCQVRVMEAVGIEKTAEWIYYKTNQFLITNNYFNIKCYKVEVFEHERNSAIYEELCKQ